MKEEAAFGRPLTLSDARSVGGGASEGCRRAGLWECSIVGTAAVVHLWGAGGSALLLEGRRRRLPTCGRPHWSRAFNNAGAGRNVERGGDDEDGQPASKREVNGRKAALVDFLLGLGNPDDLGRHDAAMAFEVFAPLLHCCGRHRRCMTSLSSSLSPGGLVVTDNDNDDETTLKRLATPLTVTSLMTSTRTRTRGEDGGADGNDDNKAIGGKDDVRHPKQLHTAIVASPHPAPPCASMLDMYPMRQEKEEERTMGRRKLERCQGSKNNSRI